MARTLDKIRSRLDRFGMALSGLCAVHCVLGLVLVSLLGVGGGVLASPMIHQAGIVLAIMVGVITIGLGALRHGRIAPLVAGGTGLALMAGAIAVGHGPGEAVLTICGVVLVALAHGMNLRAENLRKAC